jgi:hypothetical protein
MSFLCNQGQKDNKKPLSQVTLKLINFDHLLVIYMDCKCRLQCVNYFVYSPNNILFNLKKNHEN